MDAKPVSLLSSPSGYASWLTELKHRIHAAQQRAVLSVNRELVQLYWHIGHDILHRQAQQGWGAKVIERLAHDLKIAFPAMKGFSRANLMSMRAFSQSWPDTAIVQQLVGQLPWGHNLVLLAKLDNRQTRLWYAAKCLEHNWSRNVLRMQIETQLLARSGQTITNFEERLPTAQSDLARESLKDPYRSDFLCLHDDAQERESESGLVRHVTEFLLELGAGFAFVGRQVLLDVGGEEFFVDLLFYHLKLRCYVVIELKAGHFKPGHLGQLGSYLTAIDKQVKTEQDNATIGLLLCKSKNKVVAEYALGDKAQPMGIAEYQLIKSLPEELQTSLPTIAQIEEEFSSSTEIFNESSINQ